MSKFFVATVDEGMAYFDDHEVRHLKVLRFSEGSEIRFTNGKGTLFLGKMIDKSTAHVVRMIKKQPIPQPRIHVILSPIRWERTRFAIEKSVELGAASLVFTNMDRTTRKETESKLRKASLIARDAAEQCGILYLTNILEMNEFVPPKKSTRLILNPEGKFCIKDLQNMEKDVIVAVGPEGGWTEREKMFFESTGFREIKIGSRVLRTETAVVVALTLINNFCGNF